MIKILLFKQKSDNWSVILNLFKITNILIYWILLNIGYQFFTERNFSGIEKYLGFSQRKENSDKNKGHCSSQNLGPNFIRSHVLRTSDK